MKIACFSICVLGCFLAVAQESTSGELNKSEHHKFTLVLGHAHLSEGINDITGKKEWRVLPAWGLDYDFILNSKWGIGIHNDIIVESFEVESHQGTVLKRTTPVATAILGTYSISEHFAAQLGFGGEFAKEQNFALTRIGIEYGYELPNDFEISAVLNYDIKWNAYDTYLIGIGIAKMIH